jgi:hypothetical protein
MVRRVLYTESAAKAHSDDVKAMNTAVLAVHAEWALLEDALAWTLARVIGRGFGDETGLIIYFTPVNAETRQAIVNRIALHRLSMRTIIPDDGLTDAWHYLMRKIDTARGFRNIVAHNHITEFDWRGKTRVRLTSSIFDGTKPPKPGRNIAEPTGLTWKMVRQGALQSEWTRKRITWFSEALVQLGREPREVQPELHQRLIGDLGAAARETDARNPIKPRAQLAPSPASPQKPKRQRKLDRKAMILKKKGG